MEAFCWPLPLAFLMGLTMQESRVTIDALEKAGLLRRLQIRIDAEADPYVTGIREVRLVTASEIHMVVGIADPRKFSGPDLLLYPPAR